MKNNTLRKKDIVRIEKQITRLSKEVLDRDQYYWPAYVQRGIWFLDIGSSDDALEDFHFLSQNFPGEPRWKILMGVAAYQNGERREAITHFKKARDTKTEWSALSHFLVAHTLFELGRYNLSKRCALRAHNRDPQNTDISDLINSIGNEGRKQRVKSAITSSLGNIIPLSSRVRESLITYAQEIREFDADGQKPVKERYTESVGPGINNDTGASTNELSDSNELRDGAYKSAAQGEADLEQPASVNDIPLHIVRAVQRARQELTDLSSEELQIAGELLKDPTSVQFAVQDPATLNFPKSFKPAKWGESGIRDLGKLDQWFEENYPRFIRMGIPRFRLFEIDPTMENAFENYKRKFGHLPENIFFPTKPELNQWRLDLCREGKLELSESEKFSLIRAEAGRKKMINIPRPY